ncbi:P-type DNA transfer protein VirB5 [Massilia sp. H6]|uniref:P-type DNA transfer protein VirB5 n=1 Tax=Massilia sp. H6 TaxID=2970464 RepID=UPI002166F0A3|nr:P-type DNA transfer protein VirB5 [Massilia sp. H6]UVW30683.1 P-type DNA transfer protein VirB5 [Massilia sp. H6]
MERWFKSLATALVLGAASQAQAGIPVIDAASLAQSVQQVLAWGKQYAQMGQQYTQLVNSYNQAVTTHNSLNGSRGMESLVNNPAVRRYLPNEWNQTMNLLNSPGGYTGLQGKINGIRAAAQITGIGDTSLDPASAAGKAFVGAQNQVAMNRALSEEGYKQASDRITSIQSLIDKIGDAPEAKDVADLQARIQAEQVMVQNELVKLHLMAQLQQAQRDIMTQQAREISMKGAKGPGGIPRF